MQVDLKYERDRKKIVLSPWVKYTSQIRFCPADGEKSLAGKQTTAGSDENTRFALAGCGFSM